MALARPNADPLTFTALAVASESSRRHGPFQQSRGTQHVGSGARAVESSRVSAVSASIHVRRSGDLISSCDCGMDRCGSSGWRIGAAILDGSSFPRHGAIHVGRPRTRCEKQGRKNEQRGAEYA
jgi:hypothetical protein